MTDEIPKAIKRGRKPLPKGAGYTRVSLSLTAALMREVEAVAAEEGDGPTIPETVRRLVIEGLAVRRRKIS